MKTRFQVKRGNGRGLSLVEILVTISVIGVISAIAVPIVTQFSEKASRSAAKRNAQLIAAAVSEAVSAGNTTILTAGDKDAAVALVLSGLPVTVNVNGTSVRLNLAAEDAENAKPYLAYENRILLYRP